MFIITLVRKSVFFLGISLFCATFCSLNLYGTHILGAEMSYYCSNPRTNTYTISLIVSIDCSGSPEAELDDPAVVGIFDDQQRIQREYGKFGIVPMVRSKTDTVVEQVWNSCGPSENLCILKGYYTGVVVLPPRTGGYILAYQRCCRTGGIVNITDPLAAGTTIRLVITEAGLARKNSGPQISSYSQTLFCSGENFELFSPVMDTYDVEKGKLEFSFYAPNLGADTSYSKPSTPVVPLTDSVSYKSGFFSTHPFGSTGNILLDNKSGKLTGRSELNSSFLVGVKIRELDKDGVLLSETHREFSLHFNACSGGVHAGFDYKLNLCADTVELKLFDRSILNGQNRNDFYYKITTHKDSFTVRDLNPVFKINGREGVIKILQYLETDSSCFDVEVEEIPFWNIKPIPFEGQFKICAGDTISVIQDYSAVPDYEWFPKTNLSCDRCAYSEFWPKKSTSYQLVTKYKECLRMDSFFIEVKKCPIQEKKKDPELDSLMQTHLYEGISAKLESSIPKFRIWPNPFIDQLVIQFPEVFWNEKNIWIEIYRPDGKLIFKNRFEPMEYEVIESGTLVGSGILYLKIECGSVIEWHKLIQK